MPLRALPLVLAALVPLAAAPQEPGVPAGSHRILGGHRFEPSSLLDDPFSSTAVAVRFGYVYAKVNGPYLARSPLSIQCCKDVNVGGFGGGVGVEIRAADWLALRLDLGTTIYTGLDREAIVVVGPGLKTTANFQLVSGGQLGDRVRLAGLVGVGSVPALNILILSGLLDAIQSGNPDARSIFDASNTLQFTFGGSVAWAIIPSLGLQAELLYIAPNKVGTVSSFSANGVVGATMLDFDFRSIWESVPIGVSASYRITSPINTETFQAQHDFLGAIGYTGRPGLSARWEIGFRRFNVRENQLLTTAAVMNWFVRYDW